MQLLNNKHFSMLEKSLDAASLRQQVISNNIANVDTPNFKRSEVRFEQYLRNELANAGSQLPLARTNPMHYWGTGTQGAPSTTIQSDHRTKMNNNGNNVDIDYEMTLLAKNQLRYNTFVNQINHEFKLMRAAIDGRR